MSENKYKECPVCNFTSDGFSELAAHIRDKHDPNGLLEDDQDVKDGINTLLRVRSAR